jgi:tRNA(Ile)-lysidine synthase
LVVCHLNYRLRGQESEADARFVRRLAARAGLPFELRQVPRLPGQRSLQMEAREARQEFLAETYTQWSAEGIFLGHQADDQVETFLFNLCRGTSSLAHAAMRFRSTWQAPEQQIVLFRPLLSVWKKELYLFAKSRHLTYREDRSNVGQAFSRNKLRNGVIPRLESELGRTIGPAILRAWQLARDDEDLLQTLVPEAWQSDFLKVSDLRSLAVPIQRRLIYRWLQFNQVPEIALTHVESVRSLLNSSVPAKVNLPGAKHCRRKAGKLFIV